MRQACTNLIISFLEVLFSWIQLLLIENPVDVNSVHEGYSNGAGIMAMTALVSVAGFPTMR